MNAEANLKEYLFVSCDIVAHSAQSHPTQTARVDAINRLVEAALKEAGENETVWASGGDGGHVAFPLHQQNDALKLIAALRFWSLAESVPLRISAHLGSAESVTGADGRLQLVGHGINLAGNLVTLGGPTRVVVSTRFRDQVLPALPNYEFHDERFIQFKKLPPESVCLLSVAGAFRSVWDTTEITSDRARLRAALETENPLEVVYRGRRLLEMNPRDEEAWNALRALTLQRSLVLKGEGFIGSIFMDDEFGPELIGASDLIERRAGEILCEKDEDGDTMFWILGGRFGGFRAGLGPGFSTPGCTPDFIMSPGELAGELAFALHRKRTATLLCLEDSVLLGFSYRRMLEACADDAKQKRLESSLNRKITARIVENVWRSAACFQEANKSKSLSKAAAPWLSLLPFTKRTQIAWTVDWVSVDHPAFESKSLCILLSGGLKVHPAGVTLDGVDYPIIFGDLPGRGRASVGSCELLSDIEILTVRWEGLQKLGTAGYQDIAAQLAGEFAKQSGEPLQSPRPVSALAVWREKLDYLRTQEALAADPALRFALSKQIQEAQMRVNELDG